MPWMTSGSWSLASVPSAKCSPTRTPSCFAASPLRNVHLDSQLEVSFVALQAANIGLQTSRARLVAVADQERSRIERDLHDGTQQHLVAMSVKFGYARELLAADTVDRAATATVLVELQEFLRIATEDLRAIAHGVYPPLLQTGGLDEALAGVAVRSGLPVHVDVQVDSRPPRDVEAALYFCCVEALQNIVKHAGPVRAVGLRVRITSSMIELEVHDDGVGFDPSPQRGLVAG